MNRGVLLGLGLVGVLVLGLVYFSRPPGALAPTPAATSPGPSHATPAAPSRTPGPDAGPQASPGELGAALDGFLGAVPVKLAPSPSELLKAALAAGQNPIDYRKSLKETLRRRRGAGLEAVKLLADGLGEADARLRFQHALAVAERLDGPMTDALLEGIEKGASRSRPDLVFALRGTREPRVAATLVELYGVDEDLKVRAQAAYVLGEGGEDWPPLMVERARVTARLDLQSEDPVALKAAGDVLGIPPLSAPDRELLVRSVRERGPPQRRMQALRALAAAKVPAAALAPTLERVAKDSSTSPEFRAQIERLLKELKRK